jgi:2-amino-4-hydroxy-6-hydroxymethyldihydropteridine diphosphokinase
MHHAYIQLGSNVGDKLAQLQTATQQIAKLVGIILKTSSVYQTAAWGNTNQDHFYNQIIIIKTTLSSQILLDTLLKIELQQGRIRTEKYAPRTIDLDILFYDNQIINLPNLQIPHPQISNRKFVLIPLVELVPKKLHPVYKKTMTQLLHVCADELEVEKI